MGKDWYLYWVGSKPSKKPSRGGHNSGGGGGDGEVSVKRVISSSSTNIRCSSDYNSGGGGEVPVRRVTTNSSTSTRVAGATTANCAPVGCIGAVLHLFDFHSFQPSFFFPDDPTPPHKGIQAPRNSLDSEDLALEGNTITHMPVGVQIDQISRRNTKLEVRAQSTTTKSVDDLSSGGNSPGAKTPNLVARLMGLDLLPDAVSHGLGSVTVTPRSPFTLNLEPGSLGRSSAPSIGKKVRRTDQYVRHRDFPGPPEPHRMPAAEERRLSFQINRENSIVREMQSARPSCSAISTKRPGLTGRSVDEESRSPGYFARQIMKQVKEKVGRRMGLDITNTAGNQEFRRDEHLLPIKPKKSHKESSVNKLNRTQAKSSRESLKSLENKEDKKQDRGFQKMTNNVGKLDQSGTIFESRKVPPNAIDVMRNKKEEQFVRTSRGQNNMEKKCKRTPLSTELLPTKIIPKASSGPAPNPRPTQLPSSPSPRYNPPHREATHAPAIRSGSNPSTVLAPSVSTSTEYQYISRVLRHVRIDKNTPLSFTEWHSPTHPLDPSIFHRLEETYKLLSTFESSELSLKCNRKLIFQLINEILVNFLKPHMSYLNQKNKKINGFQLVKILCSEIRSFPRANCQVLQDIDGLVERDLGKSGVKSVGFMGFEEEFEGIVLDIESDILDSLVLDMIVVTCGETDRWRR